MHFQRRGHLRPHTKVPAVVEASISPKNTYSFLKLLACHPLSSFDDCEVIKRILRDIKEYRRYQGGVRTSMEKIQDSEKQGVYQQKSDGETDVGGLLHEVTNLPTAFDEDVDFDEPFALLPLSPMQLPRSGRAVSDRRQIIEREDSTPIGPQFQAEVPKWTGPQTTRKEIRSIESVRVYCPDSVTEFVVNEFLERCRKHVADRYKGAGKPLSEAEQSIALRSLTYAEAKVDLAFKFFRSALPDERETLVSLESVSGLRLESLPWHVSELYLRRCNDHFVRRTGYPMTPMGEERALKELSAFRGNFDLALKQVLDNMPRYSLFDGERRLWSDAERTLFLRTLADAGHDFQYMSRRILKTKTTAEIVQYYYARYLQVWSHHGGMDVGSMYDYGHKRNYASDKSAQAQLNALKALARSAGDGFPPAQIMSRNIRKYRNAKVQKEIAERQLASDRLRWSK